MKRGRGERAYVACSISHEEIETEDGRLVEGVVATCGKCGHETQSFGTGEASVRRCFVLLRQECPNKEANYYDEE